MGLYSMQLEKKLQAWKEKIWFSKLLISSNKAKLILWNCELKQIFPIVSEIYPSEYHKDKNNFAWNQTVFPVRYLLSKEMIWAISMNSYTSSLYPHI